MNPRNCITITVGPTKTVHFLKHMTRKDVKYLQETVLYTVRPQYFYTYTIGTHIILLRTDGLNKALCQSATALFVVVGCGSVISEN